MICYKDRLFCSSDCVETRCFRFLGPDQLAAADKWWEGFKSKDPTPISQRDLSTDCIYYTPLKKVEP